MDSKLELDGIMLNYALRERKFMVEMSKSVKPEYFSNGKLQLFYSIVLKNFQDPNIREVLSPEALADYANKNDLAKYADDFKVLYKKALAYTMPDTKQLPPESDFGYYLKQLKSRFNVRVIEATSKQVVEGLAKNLSAENLNKIITDTVYSINTINQIEVFDEGSVGDDVINMWKEYEAIENSPEEFRGVMSGYPSLDNITNGFQGSELIIIAGMEGTGKSILMHNMGVNAWLGTNRPGNPHYADNGHNILYFTLEMPRSNRGETTSGGYLNKRILSCVSELNFENIRKGNLSPEDRDKLRATCDFVKDYSEKKKFYVVDIPRGARVEDIEVKYLELREKLEIDLVIIDYIGIMAGAEKDENDWQAQGNVAASLHEFARSYNVPVLTAVQLNRPQGVVSLDKQKYNNTRVARSAMITQNANMVLAIGCRDNEEMYPDMPLYITKMRDGRKGALILSKSFERMKVFDGSPIGPGDEMDDFEDFDMLTESELGEFNVE